MDIKQNNYFFLKLTQFVENYCGISLSDKEHKRVMSIISKRLTKTNIVSTTEYINHITNVKGADELKIFINNITISETYFFRDNNQFNALTNYIIPAVLKRKKEKKLKIWSAGCSSGEEAYSIAIALHKADLFDKFDEIKIIGSDINSYNIEKANSGIFSKHSFRGVNDTIIEKYFSENSGKYSIIDQVKKKVEFKIFNIKIDQNKNNNTFLKNIDIIFCRNVIIYFDKTIINNILKNFYKLLVPEGFLILGHSETPDILGKNLFIPIKTNNTFIYKVNYPPDNQQKKNIIQLLPSDNNKKQTDIFDTLLNLYLTKDYLKAKNLIEKNYSNTNNINILTISAMMAINREDFKQTFGFVDKIFSINEFSPEAYFIKGLVYEEKKKTNKSVKAYETSIFLNPSFFMSYFRLAQIYQKEKKYKKALITFNKALSIIDKQDVNLFCILSGGYSKKSIKTICTQLVQLLEKDIV